MWKKPYKITSNSGTLWIKRDTANINAVVNCSQTFSSFPAVPNASRWSPSARVPVHAQSTGTEAHWRHMREMPGHFFSTTTKAETAPQVYVVWRSSPQIHFTSNDLRKDVMMGKDHSRFLHFVCMCSFSSAFPPLCLVLSAGINTWTRQAWSHTS